MTIDEYKTFQATNDTSFKSIDEFRTNEINNDLIKQIEETRKKIQEKTEKRLSPDVIYERKLANRDENILKTKRFLL